jgi:hypothetical protein
MRGLQTPAARLWPGARYSPLKKSQVLSARRILYVVSHWPGAPPYGAQQRVLHIGRLLQKVGDVSLVVLTDATDDGRWRPQTETEFKIARVIKVTPVSGGGLVGRFRHEFDPRYLQTVPCAWDQAAGRFGRS